jgi:hypothetical protein
VTLDLDVETGGPREQLEQLVENREARRDTRTPVPGDAEMHSKAGCGRRACCHT